MHFISKELTPGLIAIHIRYPSPPPPITHTQTRIRIFMNMRIFFCLWRLFGVWPPHFQKLWTAFVLLLLYGLLAFFSPNIARYKNEDYIFGHCFRSFIIIDWNYRTPKQKIWIKITKSFIFKHIKNNFFL